MFAFIGIVVLGVVSTGLAIASASAPKERLEEPLPPVRDRMRVNSSLLG